MENERAFVAARLMRQLLEPAYRNFFNDFRFAQIEQ
jgi:hypothetical protein